MSKEEYLSWFRERDFKNFEVDFSPNGILPDSQKLVDNHIEILEKYWGNPEYRHFARRLNKVKKEYEKRTNENSNQKHVNG